MAREDEAKREVIELFRNWCREEGIDRPSANDAYVFYERKINPERHSAVDYRWRSNPWDRVSVWLHDELIIDG